MRLSDVSEWDKPNAILDKKGNVLCPMCEKRFAIVNEYGMIRKCEKCKDIKNGSFNYSFVDANGFKSR